MSNWDLMMPGMGLTAIGLAGVVISYAGIAHTFIDGMHALTGLTMFIGLIFLSVGILDGGISTSNRAKATVLVIISIALGFGMYGFTMNTSNYVVTIAGILMGITFPAIIIAYLAMKHPTIVKPIGSIVAMAGATGIIMWLAFGFVSPDTYIIPQQVIVEEEEEEEIKKAALTGPVFAVQILEGSLQQGNPDYGPDVAVVPHGHVVEWTNMDSAIHTVTSTEGFGELFESGYMDPGDVYALDTTGLEAGEYEYLCTVHVWMTSTLVVEEPREPVKVTIPDGAAFPEEGKTYYDLQTIDVKTGTTVAWDNADNVAHTVTSGRPDAGADETFDSESMEAGDIFEFTFTEAGNYDYYCVFHLWMVGTVNVE